MNGRPIDGVVARLENCRCALQAMAYYERVGVRSNEIGKEVLKYGAADFDDPHKAWVYVRCYMSMHYRANKAVFAQCKFLADSKILFVDFGCGPMTSGLALLGRLKKTHALGEVVYCGVDVSTNMREIAQAINGKHRVFKHFRTGSTFDEVMGDLQTVVKNNEHKVVINFSYVLADGTLKEISVEDIASKILSLLEVNQGRDALYLIYQNPKDRWGKNGFIQNWRELLCCLRRSEYSVCVSDESEIDYGRTNPICYAVAHITKLR